MAVKYIERVWEHSSHRGSHLLMLLAFADYANDEGISWPKMETIARKTRLSTRQAQRVKSQLIESGELQIVDGFKGRSSPDQVKICIEKGDIHDAKRVTSMTQKGDIHDAKRVTSMTPPIYDPSLDPSLDPSIESSSSSKRDDDDDCNFILEMLRDEFEITKTETVVGTVAGWLEDHPASHVQDKIIRAKRYTPDAPLVYISQMLKGETGRQRVPHNGGYEIPDDMKGIYIG